eukprot:COSAG01_NODE_175_length_22996_cov_18.857892_18_plen_146_part_00
MTSSAGVVGVAISIDSVTTSDIVINGTKQCPRNTPRSYCRQGSPFQLHAGQPKSSTGAFFQADGQPLVVASAVGGVELHVFSSKIARGQQATGVSYGYDDWPLLSVYNQAGFPMSPFLLWPEDATHFRDPSDHDNDASVHFVTHP